MAGHVRLELRNVGANYPFEKSRRFVTIHEFWPRRPFAFELRRWGYAVRGWVSAGIFSKRFARTLAFIKRDAAEAAMPVPPIPDSTEAVKPEGTQGQSAPWHRHPDVLGQIRLGVWTAALSLVSFWMTSIMLSVS